MTDLQHQERCPDLRYDLWERINNWTERVYVDLILDDGAVIQSLLFADGACCAPVPSAVMSRVVDVRQTEGQ